jgi:hypothetical protein
MGIDRSSAAAVVEFAEALARLESVATLYSAEHARSREAAARTQAAIRDAAGVSKSLCVELGDECLFVNGECVALDARALAALHAELDGLGFARLELDASATEGDLHRLASSLRAVGQRLGTTHSLQVVDLGPQADSVRVHLREFGRRVAGKGLSTKGAGNGGGTVEEWVQVACAPLDSESVDARMHEACSGWVKESMRRIVERVEHGGPSADPNAAAGPRRALDDVLQLAGRTMERALSDFLANTAGADDLKRMFQSIETAAAVCDDAETASLMVEVLRESAEEVLGDGTAAEAIDEVSTEQDECALSLEELQKGLDEYRQALGQMAGLEREDRSEALSIVLAALVRNSGADQVRRGVERLRTAAAPPLERSEKAALQGGLRDLCAAADEPLIDRTLPRIAACLYELSADTWLALLVQAAEASPTGELAKLWPQLAIEVLRGPRTASESALHKVLLHVARLPREQVDECARRLQHHPEFQELPIARYAFASLRDDLVPFHALLLRSRRSDAAGAFLLESLKLRTPTWPGGIVFHTFERFDAPCRDLILDLFKGGGVGQAAPEVQTEAVRRIAERIAMLPCERATDPWVARAIEALGHWRSPESERALARVLDEKKHMLAHSWPAACREAARRAQASHAKKPSPKSK